MTSNDDQRSLFLSSSTAEADEAEQAHVDDSDEAMRRLRDPFAVTPPKRADRPAAPRH